MGVSYVVWVIFSIIGVTCLTNGYNEEEDGLIILGIVLIIVGTISSIFLKILQ